MLRTVTTTLLLAVLTTGGETRTAVAQTRIPILITPHGQHPALIFPALDPRVTSTGDASLAFAHGANLAAARPGAWLSSVARPQLGNAPPTGALPTRPAVDGFDTASAGQGDGASRRLVIPEPATLLLAALGLAVGRPRRRTR